jgi:hypothetical protein
LGSLLPACAWPSANVIASSTAANAKLILVFVFIAPRSIFSSFANDIRLDQKVQAYLRLFSAIEFAHWLISCTQPARIFDFPDRPDCATVTIALALSPATP